MIEIISDLPVSSLRQRMIDEMNMRRFARKTQIDYVRHVERFAYYLGRPPDTATSEDLRQFQIDQQDAGVGLPTMNSIVSALRFLFTRTLDRPDLDFVKHPRSLPTVLSPDEVARLLGATTSLKHQAALSVAYGAGLRVAEVAMLKVRDIDSERMLLRVERGKGGRYRNAILPAGGIAPGGERWISSRPAFLLPVRVLGKLFRRLFLTRLTQFYDTGKLAFFGPLASLSERRAFLRHLAPVRKKRWVVYAKPPFAGPEAVLAYLSRYTHRVAISNRRILAFNGSDVTLRYKDYRKDGADRERIMTIPADEFIRRFLTHVLPRGFHRIRHYGLLAGSSRKASLALARDLLHVAPEPEEPSAQEPVDLRPPCTCCGGHMIIIETFERWRQPRAPPVPALLIREHAS